MDSRINDFRINTANEGFVLDIVVAVIVVLTVTAALTLP